MSAPTRQSACPQAPAGTLEQPSVPLLLHTCCGPCACGCVPVLCLHNRRPVLFFSNSNLCSEAEYARRLAAAEILAGHCGVELIADPYRHDDWLDAVSVLPGYADEPERGARCRLCFAFSLSRTACLARERGMRFATSLTVSPYKNSGVLFDIGAQWPEFEPWNFKKGDGYRHSIQLSLELGLYRQTFCGCEFSLRDRQQADRELFPGLAV